MLAYSTTNIPEDGPIGSNPSRDEADFACGRHFEHLEGGNPAALLKASHRQNGPRQHHNLNVNRP